MRRAPALLAALALFAGCAMGPDYKRPATPKSENFRGALEPAAAASLADLPWWEVFQDPVLRQLIEEALKTSYDVRIAAARVEQMRALLGVAKSDFYPQLGYQINGARGQNAAQYGIIGPNQANAFSGNLSLNWELDIWGRIRRSTEAARAQLMSSEYARQAIVMSLVTGVAQAYFELRELDLQLEITQRSVKAFQDTFDLFSRKFAGGAASKLEISRAGAALAQAAEQVPSIENQIFAKENEINFLLGRLPQPIPRGASLMTQRLPPATPAGLPSALLERRPDVREAEEGLRSANAQVGVAKASFFPKLSLTGLLGIITPNLQSFSLAWAAGGGLVGPLFQGLRLYDNYVASKAAWEQAKLQYQRTVLSSLHDVANALVQQQKLGQIRDQQAKNVDYLRDSVKLATLRYIGGLANYYEVLEAQQQLFPAETSLAQTDLYRLLAVVQLYKALGGGWGIEPKPAVPPAPASGVAKK